MNRRRSVNSTTTRRQDETQVGDGTRLLDVGCGSGLAAQLAAGRGARVSGLDASPGLPEIARERVPTGDFRVGEMGSLPWGDASFDAVTFVNTFFFAADRKRTMGEAARVTRPGGCVAVVAWPRPDRVELMAYLQAVAPLLPPSPVEIDPFVAPEELERLAREAGLAPQRVVGLDWSWEYPDERTLLRGLLSPGLSTLAVESAGEEAMRDALIRAFAPYRRGTGAYRVENAVHCLVATRD